MFELSADTRALTALSKNLARAADGKQLRKDLAKNMRAALAPAKQEVAAGIMSMASDGEHDGALLRPAIVKRIKVEARLSGRSTGARIKARKVSVRGQWHAGRYTNRAGGWRHPVATRSKDGTDVRYVQQIGKPGWFDDPLKQGQAKYRLAVLKSMGQAAKRMSVIR